MSKKPEVLMIEVADQADSGFILDGTQNTPAPQQLRAPSVLWLPANGYRTVEENGRKKNVKIRFIKNCDIIDPVEQDKLGIKPNPKEDKILLNSGVNFIVNEGATIGLYNYLKVANYNASAPLRPDTATARYRELELNKKAEEINEDDFVMGEAIEVVKSLVTKTGKKDVPYVYDEQRIDALCQLLNVTADTPSQKVFALMSVAKVRSLWFMETVTKFESVIAIEVAQAMQAEVVYFDGNTALFSDDQKVIVALGTGKISHENKIEKLANFLKTHEGAESLSILRAKLEVAKNKSLS